MMNECGKSDSPIIPEKCPNKVSGYLQTAEGVEERRLAEGNLVQQNKSRTQCREILQNELNQIRLLAVADKEIQFDALWHHVYNVDRLREAYYRLRRNAAPGLDGKTWRAYGNDLENNLQDLSNRLKTGAYQAKPVNRAYIEKPDGKRRL